jgi:hypothetical protein
MSKFMTLLVEDDAFQREVLADGSGEAMGGKPTGHADYRASG